MMAILNAAVFTAVAVIAIATDGDKAAFWGSLGMANIWVAAHYVVRERRRDDRNRWRRGIWQ